MRFIEKMLEKMRDKAAQHGYTCDDCGAEIFNYPQTRLCEDCENAMRKNDELRCDKCGRKTLSKGVCLTCKRDMPTFTQGFTPFVYRAETAALINRMKNGTPRLAYYFAERMAECFALGYSERMQAYEGDRYEPNTKNRLTDEESILIVPVPLTNAKKQERGYNQSAELARAVMHSLYKHGIKAELDCDVLQKRRETKQQKQSGYRARKENVEGAYHVHKRKVCQNRVIILIDDIMTTGATASECASRLFGAGAKEVYALMAAALPELQ